MTELSTDEQAIVDRFGIFEPERREAAVVEEVARAMYDSDTEVYHLSPSYTWSDEADSIARSYRRLAVAAVVAYRATQDGGAEEDWGQHVGSCRIFYAERRCTCGGGR
jgi:hypothetical protein